MEMDSVELDHDGDFIMEETSSNQFLSPGSADVNDIFGDPQILPRVGDQYQVEIPSLITEIDRLHLIKNPIDTEVMVDVSPFFVIGLPIPVMWVHDQVDGIKREPLYTNGLAESVNSKVSHKSSSECAIVGIEMDLDLHFPRHEQSNPDQKYANKGYSPVPGSLNNSWSDLEQQSFLLGLYIFGKNLIQVKRFIEGKEMGDVLSHYYGKFYRSDGYCRWSECRKIRSRRCVQGQRIFTGSRQQELLSRLLPHVAIECQNTLVEVSKMFGEGKVLLEDYVSTLKAIVGMSTLVEAIGIGRGKQDLTGITEPIKTNQVIPIRQEIPSGKECNSLTSDDIIKFLTGDFRLSKARSNDLFWEAVWPRLLARGWHSEQPKNQGYGGSNHSLVFLIPGVKKFSRRRLMKGKHYFDSVSDVLNKVALEPKLIDVEVEAPKGGDDKEEYGSGTEMALNEDGPSDSKRHCYLQPHISNCTSNIMKFTVVDTSLVDGDGPPKVRELRTLPVELANSSTPTSLSRETDGESSEEPVDEPDSASMLLDAQGDNNTIKPEEDLFGRGMCSQLLGSAASVTKPVKPINGSSTIDVSINNHEEHYPDMCIDKHPMRTVKCQISRKMRRSQSNKSAPFMKRRRLTACHAETSRIMNSLSEGSELKEDDTCCHFDSPDASENMVSSKCSPDDNSERIHSENCFGTEQSLEKAQPRLLIDLNLPHDLQDFEIGEPFITEDDPSTKGSSIQSETNWLEDSHSLRTSNGVVSVEQQSVVNARRQSTRNRPLTMRALEALACGFLYTKRTRRGTEAVARENSIPRPSRRARGRVDVSANLVSIADGVVDPKVDTGVDAMGNKSQVQSGYHSEILAGKDYQSS